MIKEIINKVLDSKAGLTNTYNRDIWIKDTLSKIPSGLRILDAGAGELKYKPYCSHLNYVAQDFAQYNGQGNNQGLQTGSWDQTKLDIACDIVNIPEPDESFDAIMCIEVLEHLPNPILALNEFTRLLKKGGYLIITAPFCSLTHQAPYHYYSGFNKYFYERHLSERSFTILDMNVNGNYFEFLAQELLRLNNVAFEYTGLTLTKTDKLARKLMLKTLERFSCKDNGSAQLLCYGFNILATKNK